MQPLLRTGDLVRVDTHRAPENGSLVAARIYGEWHIRWLYREAGFQSLNPTDKSFSPIILEPDMDFLLLGVVSRIIRPER
jgi:SOS-response transcriptional repressor LexA